jgi:hypothetical protein
MIKKSYDEHDLYMTCKKFEDSYNMATEDFCQKIRRNQELSPDMPKFDIYLWVSSYQMLMEMSLGSMISRLF